MASDKKQAGSARRDEAAYIAALREERAGYERRGDSDGVKRVDVEIKAAEKRLDPKDAKPGKATRRAASGAGKKPPAADAPPVVENTENGAGDAGNDDENGAGD